MKINKLLVAVLLCCMIGSIPFISAEDVSQELKTQQDESSTQLQQKTHNPSKKQTPTRKIKKHRTRLDMEEEGDDEYEREDRDGDDDDDEYGNGERPDRKHDRDDDDDLSLLREHGAFIGSFLSILITEIGDKTFIVTAVLATKYNKLWVFIGSYGALFLMTLISCFIGNVSLSLINPDYIKYLAAALFFIFGGKAIYEAATNKLEDDEEEIEHDLKELDEKFNKKVYGDDYKVDEEENKNGDLDNGLNAEPLNQNNQIAEYQNGNGNGYSNGNGYNNHQNENGGYQQYNDHQNGDYQNNNGHDNNQQETNELQKSLLRQQQKQNKKNMKNAVPNTFIAAQTFAQNFLGEWGDRSQISTIAMSASFNFFQVFLGCALGHAACSYLAITGGKLLAEKFSERTLTLAGGILFVIYGIATLFTI